MTEWRKCYLQNVSRKCSFSQSETLDFQNFPGEHAPGPPSRTKISVRREVLYFTWNPLTIWPGSAPDSPYCSSIKVDKSVENMLYTSQCTIKSYQFGLKIKIMPCRQEFNICL